MRSFFYAGYPFCKQNHTHIATKSYTYCNKIVHLLQQNHILIAKKSYTYGKNRTLMAKIIKNPCSFRKNVVPLHPN